MTKEENPFSFLISKKMTENPQGIFSVCSANPQVLDASLTLAKDQQMPLLVEATCNQVNQFGGYTGMKPLDFQYRIEQLALARGFGVDNLYLGGDHLGPSPWKEKSASEAMANAEQMVHDYVCAGFIKIHLDTSMACADDPPLLPKETIARRQARLCQTAEKTHKSQDCGGKQLVYVLGTEVPTPGGAVDEDTSLKVTSTDETIENIDITKSIFKENNLEEAWERTIAFVVQPGVEFGDSTVHEYQREKAQPLSKLIEGYPSLVYEAHSTDYQTSALLRQMVEDHFAILKVGPALTFALREAIFALSYIEEELLRGGSHAHSHFVERLDQAMIENPIYWEKYYEGDGEERSFKRKFSYSDRSRYYWTNEGVEEALALLLSNLNGISMPLSLISQFLPLQYNQIRNGEIENEARDIIRSKVISVLDDYRYACRV